MEAPKDRENSKILPPKTLTLKLLTVQHSVKSQSSGFCHQRPEGVRQSHLNFSFGASLSLWQKGKRQGPTKTQNFF
ncbi:hypothetical protein [Nostoc sp. 'Peltigera membranacea cyanobiont' 213]|uniref:hypothetical protein n=1 Tax=Nostoc sp. 'Peltigera membranacea cyanobiont' 213 TaxID=2014530 RepID=UPI0011811FD3|nr:hypothetical protein [Nostoc sp. 'Peltigera membranacea cyanobiont' 213]